MLPLRISVDLVLYSRKGWQLWCIKIFFSFYYQNVRMERIWKAEDGWAAHTRAKVRFFSEPLSSSFSSDRNLPGCTISWTPTQIPVVTPPRACRLYVARKYASFKYVIHAIDENICVLFTLVAGVFPVTFVPTVRIPSLHRRMSMISSNQYHTLGNNDNEGVLYIF